ncbi:hypothetical protein P775_20835 [Puniceibacterium antarcticum]|uniref:YjiS-like domain-containing protein n=1 Tax=Puniceibacterium antarcticum TaxID=1206336 RepID=A0A2G8R9I9_9RHOB|nr:DUF1127 domain-containing protein [Puniceibacterium antarcticum]PIL18207.1 hypothetical protein P775_20835 [Puniceibacterium antarcticum]
MAYATNINTASQGAAASRFSAVLNTLRTGMAKRKLYRNTLNELQSLNDRELADLGLHRSMLRRIAYEAANQA